MSANGVSDTTISAPMMMGRDKKAYRIRNSNFEVDCRYDIVKAIGYGAYGFVCSARDTVTGDMVAIKKIPKVFDDLIDGKRILREVKILPILKHPNIMSLKDLLRPREGYSNFRDLYLVSELMETDLHQVIRSKQPLTEEHIHFFSFQMFRALKYMHSKGVMHRDMKPGNLLVNGRCELKICDFGLARGGLKNVQEPQELTDYVITRWYRPPELLLMCHYSAAVDVWSAGLIILEMYLRRPALPGKDYVNQLSLITDLIGTPKADDLDFIPSLEALAYLQGMAEKKPQPLHDLIPRSSPHLQSLIAGCLQFNPNRRLTAAEVLDHPYFSHLVAEMPCPVMVDSENNNNGGENSKNGERVDEWDFDYHDITEPELRTLFWREILKYHPEEAEE
eukprot:PhM_4_TR7676/c0_g2_i1/m.8903/K04371/MAPK1_3; mitogen-activated protein kinase 1/3